MQSIYERLYKPDVLSCLADLSNDEVFTPPDIANKMLDLLPQELFKNKETKILDPACKSGVILREAAKRFIEGERDQFESLQECIDWVFHNQIYGIAITELTSLLSRRSVYCSKYPNSPFSITKFEPDDVQGNILFHRIQHTWEGLGEDKKCAWCGASMKEYKRSQDLETHAYEFIHTINPEEILDMKFDVICSNPPYQLSDGGSKASAKPIYQLFVEQAKKLNPRYMTMIIPARWYTGGKGLDAFRASMLNDKRVTNLIDFFDSTECFPGVDISGGICYFLWERDREDNCVIESHRASKVTTMKRPLLESGEETFIRFNEAMGILHKVRSKNEPLFYNDISSRKPFGLDTATKVQERKTGFDMVQIYAYPKNGYIKRSDVPLHPEWIDKTKVCISYAYGERGEFPYLVIGKPFIAPAGSCCTETYLVVATFDEGDTDKAKNMISYMTTKFFRFLVLLKKNTQHATRGVYSFVPMQDFSKPWTDAELYKKYELTDEEIEFIESMIRPMDLTGGNTDA